MISKKHVTAVLASVTLLLGVSQAYAEYRTVLLQVRQGKDKKTTVAIHSDEKKEQRSAASVDEAVKVVGKLTTWGSSVGVYIECEAGIPRTDTRRLLKAVYDNALLDLVHFGREVPTEISDHFQTAIPGLRVPGEKEIAKIIPDDNRPVNVMGGLRSYRPVSKHDWLHTYHHVAGEDRVGAIVLHDGSSIRYMFRPGGLATLTFANGRTLFLAREVDDPK